jgi:hypothetical protein
MTGSVLANSAALAAGQTITTPLLPGVSISIEDLLS